MCVLFNFIHYLLIDPSIYKNDILIEELLLVTIRKKKELTTIFHENENNVFSLKGDSVFLTIEKREKSKKKKIVQERFMLLKFSNSYRTINIH